MNFILFLIALVGFHLLYHFVLSWIMSLPGLSIMAFLSYLSEHPEKHWTKIAFVPTLIIAFIIGTILPCALFGMGIGVTVLLFTENISFTIIYLLIGGIAAFCISEAPFPGMLISLATYIITITVPKLTTIFDVTLNVILTIFFISFGLFIFGGIVWLIISFIGKKITKKTELKNESQQATTRRLSTGIYIISILLIFFGGVWTLRFFITSFPGNLAYLFWGVPFLIGGIGMLKKQYWALRLNQVFLILSILTGILVIRTFLAAKHSVFAILLFFSLIIVFTGLPIWFLFKKSTVNQFKKSKAQGIPSNLDESIEINPLDHYAWHAKGVNLTNLGKYQEALIYCDEALRINRDFGEAWNTKGIALGYLGRYQEAIVCFDEALRINRDFADAWNNKGAALNGLGRYQEAIVCCDEALRIDSKCCGTAWLNKASSLYCIGRYHEALQSVEEAIRFDPKATCIELKKLILKKLEQ